MEKPEMQFILLKILVGERGFEPPTPWARTRCSTRLSHSPTDGWMTATTGTTWRLELTQYSILGPGDLVARAACAFSNRRLFLYCFIAGYRFQKCRVSDKTTLTVTRLFR